MQLWQPLSQRRGSVALHCSQRWRAAAAVPQLLNWFKAPLLHALHTHTYAMHMPRQALCRPPSTKASQAQCPQACAGWPVLASFFADTRGLYTQTSKAGRHSPSTRQAFSLKWYSRAFQMDCLDNTWQQVERAAGKRGMNGGEGRQDVLIMTKTAGSGKTGTAAGTRQDGQQEGWEERPAGPHAVLPMFQRRVQHLPCNPQLELPAPSTAPSTAPTDHHNPHTTTTTLAPQSSHHHHQPPPPQPRPPSSLHPPSAPTHLWVAQHHQAVLGPSEGHVEAARVRQETYALRVCVKEGGAGGTVECGVLQCWWQGVRCKDKRRRDKTRNVHSTARGVSSTRHCQGTATATGRRSRGRSYLVLV